MGAVGFGLSVFGFLTVAHGAPRATLDRDGLHAAIDVVLDRYVTGAEDASTLRASLDALVASLDPYSYVIPPVKASASSVRAAKAPKGTRLGTGMTVVMRRDKAQRVRLEVAAVLPDSPAARAGVRPSDEVLRISGRPASEVAHQGMLDLWMEAGGEEGLALELRGRDGGTPRVLTVPRVPLPVDGLVDLQVRTVGVRTLHWLHVRAFVAGSAAAVERALARAVASGASDGVVLDLRGNPGGEVDEAIRVADMLLPAGLISRFRARGGQIVREATATSSVRLASDVPVVVIQDRYTASAAELLSAALQDHRRARVLGERSFGKGSVQELIGLGDGSKIRLTVAHYYTPEDRAVHGRGVSPDVAIDLSVMESPVATWLAPLQNAVFAPTPRRTGD